ncbi:hypothetical protein LWI29_007492 [Acer saccharum]|uniref:Bulb-type lectin domain-containing protein n=1 Tax=Acer saccharum TaxID=4024 RepID=A0AA39SCR2_ACESA|nr:hypothetical protein LWI29_007492 [Acer saccharum]
MATLAALSSVIFLCLSQLPYYSSAVNITLGSSLSSATDNNSSWLSPSGEFAFGFRQLNNSDLFLLAIWFNEIPERTIVWYANGDNPAPRGSTLELTTNGLVVNNPGGQTVWNASPSPTNDSFISVTEAAMLDTGNFVLKGNGSDFVWESFRNPTDTILPTQTLDLGSMLFSKLTPTNFSKGRFELHFDDGSVQLNPVAWPGRFLYNSYYNSETNRINSSGSGNKFAFNALGDIYIVKTNGEIAQLSWETITPSVDHYYRATLDFDGVFTQYDYQKNSPTNQSWRELRKLPENICTAIYNEIGSGTCGFNSYCSIQNRRPSCYCPPGYVFVDPSNRFMGCRPNFRQGCGGDDGSRDPRELYEIREFSYVNWPLGDYERLEPYSQKDCEQSCIYDCSCAVAIYNGSTTCWKKKLPLSNGRDREPGSTKVLFKVRKGDSSSGFGDNSSSRRRVPILLGALLLGGSVFFNVILLVAISLVVFVWHKRGAGNNAQDSRVSDTNIRCFTYKELEEVTDGRSVEMECEEENRAILTDWACECYVERRLDVLVDDDETAMADKARLHKWLMIAIWCIQDDPSTRPTMKMVVQMLEGLLEVPQPPSLPSSAF